MYNHPDLHIHSNVSDGSDSPSELLNKVRNTDIDVFSLTDHDAFQGCLTISDNLKAGDPLFIPGIELSCRDSFGKYHILGYCCNTKKQSIRNAVDITHSARREKAENRFRFLEDECNFDFTDDEKDNLLQNENPGKPHFVTLMLKKGYIKDKSEGFKILSGYHGRERRLTPEDAIESILYADGIPVLAHGILADGTKNLTEEQIEERVKRLKEYGLMGLECYYSSYTDEQTKIMLLLAHKYNLMVTAGSDYHGKNKTVVLGDSGSPDSEEMNRFYLAVNKLLGMNLDARC